MNWGQLLVRLLRPVQQTQCERLPIDQQFFCVASGWRDTVIRNIPGILTAIVVLVIALLIDDRVQRWVERIVGLRNGRREIARLLGRMARISVLLLALLYILSIFKLDTLVTSFIASLGIAGLVIAFALQDITKNFAAGVLLLIQRPFRLDDRIKVKDFEGTVIDVSIRATALRTLDGDEVLVPNADVYSSPIINFTRYPYRRYHVPLLIPVKVPIEPLREQLQTALREIPQINADPPAQVNVTTITAEHVTLDVTYWLPSQQQGAAQIMNQVVERLHEIVERHKQVATPPTPQ